MQWTDRIRQVKILLVVAAVVIAVLSLVVSHLLTRDLSDEERSKMEVWSEAMRALNRADENTDLALVLKVIDQNHTIPVVVMGADGQAQFFRNVNVDGDNYEDSLRNAQQLGQQWLNNKQHIRIQLSDSTAGDYIDVCYDDSVMLRRLQTYPFVQLGVVMIFVVVAIFALLTSKRAEQNKVWVGLSKETAHQLGTPISSLMAWTEILKESYPDDDLIPEMDKDVKRLQLIADRFSKIGSLPEPVRSGRIRHIWRILRRQLRKPADRPRLRPPRPGGAGGGVFFLQGGAGGWVFSFASATGARLRGVTFPT